MKSLAAILAVLALTLILTLAWGNKAHALFSEVTISDEAEMGREFHQKITKMLPLVEDPMVENYVKSVVDRVVQAMPPQPFRTTTTVIMNNSMNAFAVPGGYVYVLTGLLLNLETEDQFAAVICHEMAHISQRHVAKRMEDMQLASIGSWMGIIAGAFLGTSGGDSTREAGQALMTVSQAGAQAAYLVYTKANEVEADHVGMNYLINSHFQPDAMPQTFDIMLNKRWVGNNSHLPSYLSTHPALSERIDYLRARVAELSPAVQAQHTDNTRFLRVQAVVRGRLSDPTVSMAYFNNIKPQDMTVLDHMAHGMVLARIKKNTEAAAAFEQALAKADNDPLILREAGRFFFMQGDFKRAEQLLQKALIRDPGDILTLFYNARLLGEQKHYAQAIPVMRKVLAEVPEDAEVHYHLGRLSGESGEYFEAHLHLAYAAVYDRDKKQALFHKGKAYGLATSPAQKEEMEKLEEAFKSRLED
ncbi:MAG: M48 family metalloprotease [Desulfovibrionaceae bacterium]